MKNATLTIDLKALAANWTALDAKTGCETAAVIKANGYGLGAMTVARTLVAQGAKQLFVATADEGVAVRKSVGTSADIFILSGHMAGNTETLQSFDLFPVINSLDQMLRHMETLPKHPFALQLDSGMNRLGLEPNEWASLRDIVLGLSPKLIMSHLACADEPDHAMNAQQLRVFREMTDGLDIPRSLAATGGILLGPDYHFDLTRPGIGLYGGAPFSGAEPVVRVDLPVIQVRSVAKGETVGYGNAWTAQRPSRVATVSGGYADGLFRAIGSGDVVLRAGDHPCPLIGRVSMDLITVDVTEVETPPEFLTLIDSHQTVDYLADVAGTIGYEILTSLGNRYDRRFIS